MFSKKTSDIFALLCLCGTGWTVVATSSSDGSFAGTYLVKSDCVTPAIEQTITVLSNAIQSPQGYSFTTLGFPTNSLVVGANNVGSLNGAYRNCKVTNRNGTVSDSFLYTCTDDGQFACNIYFSSN